MILGLLSPSPLSMFRKKKKSESYVKANLRAKSFQSGSPFPVIIRKGVCNKLAWQLVLIRPSLANSPAARLRLLWHVPSELACSQTLNSRPVLGVCGDGKLILIDAEMKMRMLG